VATLSWNADGGTTVGNAIGEGVDAASLVAASQTESVVLTVDCNVLLVAALELLDRSLDVLHATWDTHLLGGEVAVKTSSVPVTRDGLGVERDLGTELLSNAGEEESGNPEVITHLNAKARTDLELPLGGHDLGVSSRDDDAGVQASLVVSLDDITAEDLSSTNPTVVWALWAGVKFGL